MENLAMLDFNKIVNAREITKTFNKNMWSRMTMQRNNPTMQTPNTAVFKTAILAIQEAYPHLPWQEACFLIRNNIDAPSKCIHCGSDVPFREGNTKEPYKKFCSNSCMISHQSNPAAESIIVNGIIYQDFPTAINALNENRATIRAKIFDSQFPEYQWADDHDAKCIKKLNDVSPLLTDVGVLNSWASNRRTFTSIEHEFNISRGYIPIAYSYFGIQHSYEQINADAIEVRDSKEKLQALYDRLTTDEIAIQLNVTPKSVQNWLKQHNIEIDYSRSQSKIEREVIDYIKQVSPDIEVVAREKSIIPAEIDIYIPSKRFGIEFNGLFYHSCKPTDRSNVKRHSTKADLAFRENITLLQFFDVDQSSNSHKLDIIKSMICNKLNSINVIKIHARKTYIKEVDKQQAISFFNENHLSGNRGCKIAYGLFHNDELVACMSFGKPLTNNKYDWEIVRFATKKFTRVVGGASKIFKHFLKHTTGSVISYVDRQHGNGKTYSAIGMSFVRKTEPGYLYTDMKSVYSRYDFQYPSILKRCPHYDISLTEFENAENNGYMVYWNAGNLVYEYIR